MLLIPILEALEKMSYVINGVRQAYSLSGAGVRVQGFCTISLIFILKNLHHFLHARHLSRNVDGDIGLLACHRSH